MLVLSAPLRATTDDSTIIEKIIGILLQKENGANDTATMDSNGDGTISLSDLTNAIQQEIDMNQKDTLFLHFGNDGVEITNQNEEQITVNIGEHKNDIIVTSTVSVNMVIAASGTSNDGRISVSADTTFVLRLNQLNLTSAHAPAFNSRLGKRVIIETADGTDNYLIDASSYELQDASESANGCVNAMGRLDLTGNGKLTVTGKRKHAIYSKKSIHFEGADVMVNAAPSDAIHSGKYVSVIDTELTLNGMKQDGIDADEYFEMLSGNLDIKVSSDGSKGIKCVEGITVSGGSITATATGNVVNKKGDLTYCTLLKADGDISLTNTTLNLTHQGEGGKCVSAKKNCKISDTHLTAELTGNGGSYTNLNGETDYYTPKAIEADDTLAIVTGELNIHCTGMGSKGIVCDQELMIGEINGDNDKLHITVVTEGTAVENNIEEDYREGCPKAFKSDDQLDILSGTINVTTKGMGGEGFESKNEIWIVGGEITCDTYDDCFNGGTLIYVYDGNIYCYSKNNDGFDSNGSIVIEGGNIFSASLDAVNESFDTEGNTLTINGGTILGIGGGEVYPQQTKIPFYSYSVWDDQLVQQPNPEIALTKGKYLTVMNSNRCLLSGYIPADFAKAIVTVASAQLSTRKAYVVAETEQPQGGVALCNGLYCTDGTLTGNIAEKFTFTPRYY